METETLCAGDFMPLKRLFVSDANHEVMHEYAEGTEVPVAFRVFPSVTGVGDEGYCRTRPELVCKGDDVRLSVYRVPQGSFVRDPMEDPVPTKELLRQLKAAKIPVQ